MAGQRELSFDEDKSIDHVARVLIDMNSGRYDKAREYIQKLDKATQAAVRRSVAARTNVYL